MLKNIKPRILELLSKDLGSADSFKTISDIANELKVAYSHAHKFVAELADADVLKIQKIGNAKICRLNLRNPLTLSHLALIESKKTSDWIKKDMRAAKILERVEQIKDSVHAIILINNKFIIIVPEKIKDADFRIFKNRKVINQRDLKKDIQFYKHKGVIIHGSEKFWSMIS